MDRNLVIDNFIKIMFPHGLVWEETYFDLGRYKGVLERLAILVNGNAPNFVKLQRANRFAVADYIRVYDWSALTDQQLLDALIDVARQSWVQR